MAAPIPPIANRVPASLLPIMRVPEERPGEAPEKTTTHPPHRPITCQICPATVGD